MNELKIPLKSEQLKQQAINPETTMAYNWHTGLK